MIQLQILNYILQTKSFDIILSNNINQDYFSDYKAEFLYIKDHFDKYGNVPDKISFMDKFPDFNILKDNVNENESFLIEKLQKDRNKRFLIETFNKIGSLVKSNDIDTAMSLFHTSLEKVPRDTSIKSFDILNGEDRYNNYIERCSDFKANYVTTGLEQLDALIGGWDRKEELVTIAARPGVGKSWFLLLSAIAAASQGLKVGLYSGEMSETKVGFRLDTLISHISNTKMIHGNVSIKYEYKEYLDKLKENIPGEIKVLTPSMIGGFAKVSTLRSWIENEHLDMLCIDQRSFMEDDRGARNPIDIASNISTDLKNLQVMYHIPVLTVSQQNRVSLDNKGAGTENIAQSDKISQDSTIVLFLSVQDGILNIHIAKCRDNGVGRDLKYNVDYDKGIWTYIPVEDENSTMSPVVENTMEFEDEYVYQEPDNGSEPFK